MSNWKKFYKKESVNYDQTRYGYWYGNLFALLHENAMMEMLNNIEEKRIILDVASGTGHNLKALSNCGSLVIALDMTHEMLLESRKKHWKTSVGYMIGDAFYLPFADNSFNVVSSSRFIHLFPLKQQQLLVDEMIRVLKPGGYLIVDFYNLNSWLFFYPIISIYRFFKDKRPGEDTRNSITGVQNLLLKRNLSLHGTVGVGSYLLYLCRFFPDKIALKFGKIFKSKPFRLFSEQFIVSAKK